MATLARFSVALVLTVVVLVRGAHGVSGIYVNNHKIDKFEADRVKLLRPASDGHTSPGYVSKSELLTKDNFTSVQQYYQYLVGEDPVKYIDLLWGKNKTQLPSIFRIGSGAGSSSVSFATTRAPATSASNVTKNTVQYFDDQSTIKNTLNNTNLAYFGDYQLPLATPPSTVVGGTVPQLQSFSTTRIPTGPSRRRRKKKPTPAPVPPAAALGVSGPTTVDLTKAQLTPETLSLLSRYYSFSCTLTPVQPIPSTATSTPLPPVQSTTRRTKTRYLTTKPTVKTTTKRPQTTTVPTNVKQRKPVVYVEPPVIKRIGGVLESVYTFMENALTSTEYVEDSEETRAAKVRPASPKVKRNTYTKVSASEPDFVASSSGEADSASRSTLPGADQTWLPLASSEGAASPVTKHFTPKLVTISGLPSTISTDGNKNKMTTNIQVTSEYTAATPPTVTLGRPTPDASSAEYDDDSSESEEEYFEDFGAFEETDDEDDEEEDEEDDENGEQYGGGSSESVRPNRQTALSNDKDYEEAGTNVERPVRIKRVKKRRRKKRPAVTSYEDTAEYSDEDSSDEADDEYEERDESVGEDDDDEEDYESGESPDGAEGFFSRMFSTFGRFVRSLGFGGAARGSPDDYEEYGGARSTTPRVQRVRRRPTRSTADVPDYPGAEVQTPERSPVGWLGLPGAYLTNELEEEEVAPTLELPAEPSPTSSGWFDLMMPWDFFNPWTSDESADQEVIPEVQTVPAVTPPQVVVTPSPSAPMSGWLSQFFGTASTTTPPPSTTTLPKPEQILSVLAQYVAQSATTKRPLAAVPSKRPSRTVSYANYQLWRIFAQTAEQLQRLEDYRQSPDGLRLQWWTHPALHRPTDVLVPPGALADSLREYLDEEGLRHEPTIRDVGQAIAYENPAMTRREQLELELHQGHPLTWYRYHRYADIVKFLYHLQRRHPEQVQLLHIGRSYEGRPITVARVSFQSGPKRPKRAKKRPAVFVEAGAHGHEWIGPSVATWLLHRLLELPQAGPSNGTSSGEARTIQSYDWYVLPVLNPDGYEYSHRYDRLWSKNRSNHTQAHPAGVGQALLSSAISWWNADKDPTGEGCYGMGQAGLDALRAEPGEFLYALEPVTGPATYGTATGYARYGAGIRYSYTLRLPDRGTHGFLLPPSSIVPIGRDTLELLRGMLDYN
uniref:Peptidase M14 domain-containing protein n=1 Tax=Anopheles quadriannulatus TaxID=34691 RepID=A0A182XED3_ANOQN